MLIGPEETSDEIALAAADALGAPAGIFNFVERDRHRFKARHGVDAAEPPPEQSICVHLPEEGDLLAIQGLTTDRRTKDLPLVTIDPAGRF